MLRLVALLYALALASGLQSCCTRLGASRVAQFTPHAAARGAVCMCEEPEAAAAPAEEAAPVEAAAEAPKRAPRKAKGTPLEELEVGAEVASNELDAPNTWQNARPPLRKHTARGKVCTSQSGCQSAPT